MEELDAALFNMRKAIEAVCSSIIRKENFKTDSRKPTLEQKLSTIANKINANEFSMPRTVSLEMMHVQKIGNYATHDQEDEIPVSKASAQAALILTKEIKDWYFSHYDLQTPKAIKTKNTSVRKKTSPACLIEELAKVDSDASVKLAEVFESIEKLGLWLQTGTSNIGSIRVRSLKRIEFFDFENNLLFERCFNFGVFYGDGKFKNFSCEGKLGKEYLQELSNIIPDSKVFEYTSTEFRNCVVKASGEGLLIKDILRVKNSWLKLLEKYLRKMNS